MAVDKLVDSTQLDADLTSVANAIRAKGGTSAQLAFPAGFVSAVEAIETGGGGSDSLAEFCNGTIASYSSALVTKITSSVFRGASFITSISIPNCTEISTSGYAFNYTSITQITLPALVKLKTYGNFDSCQRLQIVDIGDRLDEIRDAQFASCNSFKTLIIRRSDAVSTLVGTNVFNSSPFASNGTGGTLYVPQALIADYQAATNWSTILGYANNSIQAIEGSQYENYFADGTPIT